MLDKLKALWAYAPERCGLILKTGEIVELPNRHPQPWDFFAIAQEDLDRYRLNIDATWHTHPKGTANLSVEDYLLFRDKLPAWFHYIISRDEVRCYYVRDNLVYSHENCF